jgi:hypothetical protein
MRALALAATLTLTLAIGACGSDDEPAQTSQGDLASLTITVDQDGENTGAPAQELKLTCESASDSDGCKAADAMTVEDLAPTPTGQACTQIFGGPETATIKGTLHGEPVDATFSRSDGCEVERWKAAEPLLSQVT